MKRQSIGFLAFAVLILAPTTRAAQITFSDTISNTTTNWSDTFNIGLFDSNLGQLQKITFTLTGVVSGRIGVESLDPGPATVTSQLSAAITLSRPDLSLIAAVIPAIAHLDNLTAFDGAIDFGGGSGRMHLNLTTSAAQVQMTPPPLSDLDTFSAPGGGMISLPVTAKASSFSSGTGNLVTLFQTLAGADLVVTYEYIVATPEPASAVTAAVGVLGLVAAGFRRRRA